MLELIVPQHAVLGQNVSLECNFNLDGEKLYSVKWYKDGNEFYRFVPQEKPPALMFVHPGVTAIVRTTANRFLSFSLCPFRFPRETLVMKSRKKERIKFVIYARCLRKRDLSIVSKWGGGRTKIFLPHSAIFRAFRRAQSEGPGIKTS